MSNGIAKLIIGGNLVANAELKTTPAGKQYATGTIIVNEYRGQGNEEAALPFRFSIWGNRAPAIVQHLEQGTGVTLVGTLRPPHAYTDNSGAPAGTPEIWIGGFGTSVNFGAARGLNQFVISGRVGKQEHIRVAEVAGKHVMNFPIAVNIDDETTLWITGTIWDATGNRVRALQNIIRQGMMLTAEGPYRQEKPFMRNDGTPGFSHSININGMTFASTDSGNGTYNDDPLAGSVPSTSHVNGAPQENGQVSFTF